MPVDLTPTRPAKRNLLRIFACIFRQRSKMKQCPKSPRLDGKNVVITGGSAGVGEFISRGLLEAGAHVTSLSRGVSRGTGAVAGVKSIVCDLADPASVVSAVNELGNQTFDIVICNSGVVLSSYQKTALGLEKTFAVNVFGHHLFYRLLIERGRIADDGRIVMTAGEIYVNADDCKPDTDANQYKGPKVYAGSKLGNLWQVLELTKRYPNIKAFAVHPGVVASGFGVSSKDGFVPWLRSKILISEEEGAQAALIAATQELPSGAYWHNVLGNIDLPAEDVAKDGRKSSELWEQLERLAEPWL